ncbi:hypothetical protein IEO21_05182 [Rhodonia placenta]|uniref:Uncharacterized protein n=1 Tax=Rhodonia placenta TaxID=104341 RepID=A0A8H7P2F3_9APHY|nr:hypothetical protein IEO21_05182 [Postia placenta]
MQPRGLVSQSGCVSRARAVLGTAVLYNLIYLQGSDMTARLVRSSTEHIVQRLQVQAHRKEKIKKQLDAVPTRDTPHLLHYHHPICCHQVPHPHYFDQ